MKTIHLLSILILCGTSACSMKDPTQAYGVRVELPRSVSGASTMNILNHSSMSSVSSISAPTSFGSFQCFGLNILGDGIKSDPRFGCSDPSKGMGLVAGFVPVSGGVIDAKVPAGANRTIQLVGVQSEIGCPLLADILAAQDPNSPDGFPGLGEPYLLGSVTTDVFTDVTVGITATFDANKKMFQGCGNSNGGQPTLTFSTINNITNIQAEDCITVGLSARNAGTLNLPSDMVVTITADDGADAVLYTDGACNDTYSGDPLSFSLYKEVPLWVKTNSSINKHFTLNVSTAASGWSKVPVTMTTVQDRFQLYPSDWQLTTVAASADAVSACTEIVVAKHLGANYASNNLSATDTYDLNLYNQSDDNALSSVEVYTSVAACQSGTGALVPSTQDHYRHYSLSGPGSLYVRAIDPQDVFIMMSDANRQPAGTMLTFQPFRFSNPYSSTFGSTTGGDNLILQFSGGTGAVIDAVKFDGIPGTGMVYNGVNDRVSCITPASTVGVKDITVVVDGKEYPIGLTYTFDPPSPPYALGGQTFTFNSAQSAAGSNLVVQDGPATSCSTNNTALLSAFGISLNANCSFSGTVISNITLAPLFFDVMTGNANGSEVSERAFSLEIASPNQTIDLGGWSDTYYGACQSNSAACTNQLESTYDYNYLSFSVSNPNSVSIMPNVLMGSITSCEIKDSYGTSLTALTGLSVSSYCGISGNPTLSTGAGVIKQYLLKAGDGSGEYFMTPIYIEVSP